MTTTVLIHVTVLAAVVANRPGQLFWVVPFLVTMAGAGITAALIRRHRR